MDVTERVRQDHRILRAKLRLLEAAMQVAPEAQFVLREMCWSLAHMLDAHITHENEVLQPYSNRINALTKERMAQEHADQRVVLRDVNTLLLGGLKTPISAVVPPLAHLIEELRAHMEEEERELFPMVDRLAEEPVQTVPPPPVAPVMTETMTVNYVLSLHPKAKEVFQAFHIDCEVDGCHCLDELYWRHGIDVVALLRTLNDSASHHGALGQEKGGLS